MKDYGVDGVFVQRFVDYTRGDQKNSVPNRILEMLWKQLPSMIVPSL